MPKQNASARSNLWSSSSTVVRTWATFLLFASALFVVQRLTFALRVEPFQRTTIWTPGALVFAALLIEPVQRWWIYYVGLCLTAYAAFYGQTTIPPATALLAAQFLFAGAAVGTWSMRRLSSLPPFSSQSSLLAFMAIAIVVVPIVTTGSIDFFRFLSGHQDVWPVAIRSALSIALGTLIATPALYLTATRGPGWFRRRTSNHLAELTALVVGMLVVGRLCFAGPAGESASPFLLYAPLPMLLWAAVRFELGGVCWALLALAIESSWAAVNGRGPFTSQSPADNVLQLQLFILAISLPLMYLAIVIHERRRAYTELSDGVTRMLQETAERERTDQRFRLVVESAPNAIVMTDAAGTIVLVNAQCEKYFGYLRDEVIGRPIEMLVPERFRTVHPGYRSSYFRTPSVRQMGAGRELNGRRKDGSEFPIEIGLTPIETDNGMVVLSAIVDITERKRAEGVRQELAHASRLAIVGELTASIAHEINQPLGAILSNADAAEMLLDTGAASLDEIRQILDDIRKDDLRASDVIRRLRTLLTKRGLESQPLNLNDVASEVLTMIRAESLRRGVAIDADFAVGLPAVFGDKIHIQQVLLNLFLNGMDAMGEESKGSKI